LGLGFCLGFAFIGIGFRLWAFGHVTRTLR